MTRILGLILAGGKATRFGGGDKSLRLFMGKPLLAHTDARLRPQVNQIALSANGDAARFSSFEMQIVSDPDFLFDAGPVAGLVAGLRLAAQEGFDFLLTVPCDAPLFPTDLASRLRSSLEAQQGNCARAMRDQQVHPVFALWRTDALNVVEQECRNGVRALWRLQSALRTIDVAFPASHLDPFMDADTPEDLERLEEASRSI